MKKGDEVGSFKREEKGRKCGHRFVGVVEPKFLNIPSRKDRREQLVQAAYEDVRVVQKNSLLRELDEFGYMVVCCAHNC